MVVGRAQLFIITIFLTIELHHAVHSLTVKDIFTPQNQNLYTSEPDSDSDLVAIIRVPRDTLDQQLKALKEQATEPLSVPKNSDSVASVPGKDRLVRRASDSKFYSDKYAASYKDDDRRDRSLKPEDNSEDDRGTTKTGTALGKRCTTCDTGYLGSTSSTRGRDRYDRYDRDPYSSTGRTRYDPYERYDRDRYDRYDDYERDGYRDTRGRNRYSTSNYDRYDPRDRYYERGVGSDNRGYDYRERDYYSPSYSRDRYEPYDDYYSRGTGYDNYASRGYSGRPDYYGSGGYSGGSSGYAGGTGGGYSGVGSGYSGGSGAGGGYARGYSYGDRDRYGGYGSGSGSGYGSYGGGYGNSLGSGYGSSGYGSGGYYGGTYGGSRSRYPSNDYDSGYRSTSYLYGRPSSTTTDNPKSSDSDQGQTVSPSQGTSLGRSK